MKTEKQKRVIALLDDGELPDQHVDPNLVAILLPSEARKTKRDPRIALFPSLRPSLIALGVVTVTYIASYFLGDVHLEHPDWVGFIPIGWAIVAFVLMAGTFGGYLLSLHEYWDMIDPRGAFVHFRHIAIIGLGFVIFVVVWMGILAIAVMFLALNLNGGFSE